MLFRAGSNRNPSGGSNSSNQGGQGAHYSQFVQVEMTNPDDQQFIVYTEWNKQNQLLKQKTA